MASVNSQYDIVALVNGENVENSFTTKVKVVPAALSPLASYAYLVRCLFFFPFLYFSVILRLAFVPFSSPFSFVSPFFPLVSALSFLPFLVYLWFCFFASLLPPLFSIILFLLFGIIDNTKIRRGHYIWYSR